MWSNFPRKVPLKRLTEYQLRKMNCIDSTKHALFSKTLDKIALSTNDGKRHDMTRFPLLLMDIGFCEGECEISRSKCDQSEIKMQ